MHEASAGFSGEGSAGEGGGGAESSVAEGVHHGGEVKTEGARQ